MFEKIKTFDVGYEHIHKALQKRVWRLHHIFRQQGDISPCNNGWCTASHIHSSCQLYVQRFPHRLLWRQRSTRHHVLTYEVMHTWPHPDRSAFEMVDTLLPYLTAVVNASLREAIFPRLRRRPSSRHVAVEEVIAGRQRAQQLTDRCPICRFSRRSLRELLLGMQFVAYLQMAGRPVATFSVHGDGATPLLTARMSLCFVF